MAKLQVGDVFQVSEGKKVYALVPNKFDNCREGEPRAEELTSKAIKVGEVLTAFPNLKTGQKSKKLNTIHFAGMYVVEKSKIRMGGFGQSLGDIYPDSWEVTARQLNSDGSYDPEGRVISFYQSGPHTIVHKRVPVVRRMKRVFV